MKWWGPPWPMPELRAPICADDRMKMVTPVGAICIWCGEEIAQGDRGVMMPVLHGSAVENLEASYEPLHIECMTAETFGTVAYLEGRCTHAGGDEECFPENETSRQTALATWDWIHKNGVQL